MLAQRSTTSWELSYNDRGTGSDTDVAVWDQDCGRVSIESCTRPHRHTASCLRLRSLSGRVMSLLAKRLLSRRTLCASGPMRAPAAIEMARFGGQWRHQAT